MEKLEITDDMLESFSKMIKSVDKQDCSLALDILNNRDESNPQSEANYNKLKTMIISNEKFFPRERGGGRWVVKIDGHILSLGTYNRNVFDSEKSAKSALSRHLTNYLGQNVEKRSLSQLTPYYEQAKLFKITHTDAECASRWGTSWGKYTKREIDEAYDPNFDKKAYLSTLRKNQLSTLPYHAKEDPYFRGLKQLFKGGNELRDFLVKNKLVTFEILK